MILFGHPAGNPNSHHAALAHFERGRLANVVVPWMPSQWTLSALRALPPLRGLEARFSRRAFAPLRTAPKVQGRAAELSRILRRLTGADIGDDANLWLMRTMTAEVASPRVNVVHAYEDAALLPFRRARQMGKATLYDLPIGYFQALRDLQPALERRHAAWLAPAVAEVESLRDARKLEEIELADLVLAPSRFVERTVQRYMDKPVALARYGVDTEFWHPPLRRHSDRPLRFLYAGHCSLRKGTPLLLEAWRSAAVGGAELRLAGSWYLKPELQHTLPRGVTYAGHLDAASLRGEFQSADVFVFPSYFEGFGLVLLEAMACGLPVIASDATAAPDFCDDSNGRVFAAGERDALISHLEFFCANRERIPAMGISARALAAGSSWENYREELSRAVARFV